MWSKTNFTTRSAKETQKNTKKTPQRATYRKQMIFRLLLPPLVFGRKTAEGAAEEEGAGREAGRLFSF